MPLQSINVGSALNDGTGESLRSAMIKVNQNFSELYSGTRWQVTAVGTGVSQQITLPETMTADAVAVYVNGVRSVSTGYTVSGTTLTITVPVDSTILAEKPLGIGLTSTGGSLPAGGTAGQVLTKNSTTNNDASWSTPAIAAPNVSLWPVFIGEFSGYQYPALTTFVTISLSAVVDSHNAWNASTNIWTVPENGIYEIAGKYRLADSTAAGTSIGIGMHTSNADHPAFFWDNTKQQRQGIQNVRLMNLTAGQQIRLFCWIGSGGNELQAAVMTIQRVR